jgi:hypothetical protein
MTRITYSQGRAAAFAHFKIAGMPAISSSALTPRNDAAAPAARTSMTATTSAAAPVAAAAPKAHALG